MARLSSDGARGVALVLDAPIEDGKAAFEGVWLGTDACEGLQFSFEAIWDEETLAISMNGVIELAN